MSLQERKGSQVTMFVISGHDISTLTEQNGRLVLPDEKLREQFKRSSGGLVDIVPEDYDAFVIVGLRHGFRLVTRMMLKYSTVEICGKRKGVTLLSSPCMDACIDNQIKDTIALKIRALIKTASNKPVMLIPTPCQIETALNEKDFDLIPLRESGELGRIYDRFVARTRAVGEQLGFTFLTQDSRTMIAGGGYTLDEYGRGGIKYGRNDAKARSAPDDLQHMNADFGRITLENMLMAAEKL